MRIINYLQKQNQEVRSIYASLNFGVLFLLISYFFYTEGYFTSVEQKTVALVVPIVYILVVFMYWIFVAHFSQLLKQPRRLFLILIHNLFLTVAISNANEYGIIAVPLYLWIIMASGMRFGTKYLYSALVISIFCVISLAIFNDYWHAQLIVSLAIVLSLMLIPLTYISFIEKLHRANAILKDNLAQMKFQAKHDFLTGLPNRAYLQSRLLKRIAHPDTHSNSFSLIFIDLDGFKVVNDELGHHIGDIVLKEVATRIQELSPPPHFAARLGGDEFVIIFDNSKPIKPVLEKLLDLLGKSYSNGVSSVSASIGVTHYREDEMSEEEQAYMMKREADLAMYEAKKLGKNQFLMYEDITHVET